MTAGTAEFVESGEAGQLLVMRFTEADLATALEVLRQVRPAGIMVASSQFDRTPRPSWAAAQSLAALLAEARSRLAPQAFIWLHEWSALETAFGPLPTLSDVAVREPKALAQLGALTAAAAKLIGFNMISLPAFDFPGDFPGDLAGDPADARSDPHFVSRWGNEITRACEAQKILACARHFPGLSPAQIEPVSGLKVIGKPMLRLWREDLVPYRELGSRLPLVEMSPAAYKAYDYKLLYPARESASVIQGLLRTKLGYKGLVVANLCESSHQDDNAAGLGETAVRCLRAGCDLVILEGKPEAARAVVEALGMAMEERRLFPSSSGSGSSFEFGESGEFGEPGESSESGEELHNKLSRIAAVRQRLPRPGGRLSESSWQKLANRIEDFSKRLGPAQATSAGPGRGSSTYEA